MRFNELNADNFLLFAIKHYENPQAVSVDDFEKDLNIFRYIKRLLRKYKNGSDLKVHLLINHFIILYNIFGDAATPMLFFKLDKDLWPSLKAFVLFLDRLPDYPRTSLHELEVDEYCLEELRGITDGKGEN